MYMHGTTAVQWFWFRYQKWASGTYNTDNVMLFSFLKFSLTPVMNLQASGCACLAVMAAGVATSGYFTVALVFFLRYRKA